jgi:4-alpha-glucanotransferase
VGEVKSRRSGILLHITSLPGGHGIGDLGPAARRQADWMHKAGLDIWQVLPITPIGEGNSPYSGRSTFAMEPLLLSLDDLHTAGLLPRSALRCDASLRSGPTKYVSARRFKSPRITAAFDAFAAKGRLRSRGFTRFLSENASWLPDWCDDQRGEPDEHAFIQFMLERQWKRLRTYAATRGIGFIGDVPIFVHADSTDVRRRPELFRLDRRGEPTVVSGVPPDDFCKDGQRWGHPHYRWAAHRREHFAWWIDRFRLALDRFDAVRVDHFIGFVRLYEVASTAKTARRGVWRRTPGRELLEVLQRELGSLPLIAEDLGEVTPAVRRLRDDFNLPGMRIAQWGFFRDGSPDLPQNHPRRCVCYPGTHDNDTVRSWYRGLSPDAKVRFQDITGCRRGADAAWAMIDACMDAPAECCIIPMQDVLNLGAAARMNRPGTPRGNWRWRMDGHAGAALARRMRTTTARRSPMLPRP